MGEVRNSRRILVERPDGTRLLGGGGCVWGDDDIKMDLSRFKFKYAK